MSKCLAGGGIFKQWVAFGLLASALLLSACFQVTPVGKTPYPTAPSPSTATLVATVFFTETSAPTLTPTQTLSPTVTFTSTDTPTPTIPLTPTPDYPDVTVKMQANCRYGPGTAYLYRWGLYPGDKADVRGRNWDGSWLWIHPFNLEEKQNCWASKIVFNETIDNARVHVVHVALPHTTFAGPPGNVQAVRQGNQVTISWDGVPLSDDKRRGYLIEAQTCQNGLLLPIIIQTDDTRYTFNDEQHCKGKSSGLLYTAEKHGYSDPVKIPWP